MIDRKNQLEKLKVFSNLPDVFENNRTIKDTTIDIQFKRGTMAVSIIPDSYHHTYKKTLYAEVRIVLDNRKLNDSCKKENP